MLFWHLHSLEAAIEDSFHTILVFGGDGSSDGLLAMSVRNRYFAL